MMIIGQKSKMINKDGTWMVQASVNIGPNSQLSGKEQILVDSTNIIFQLTLYLLGFWGSLIDCEPFFPGALKFQ
jgi:hypothetical protein